MKEQGMQILPAAMSIIMKKACAIACFLTALVTEGSTLSCIKCSVEDKLTCTGPPVICQSDSSVCISKLTRTLTGSGSIRKWTTEFSRSCGSYKKQCLKLESVTAPNYHVRSNSSCCNTNNCDPDTPILLKASYIPNGVMCGACNSWSSSPYIFLTVAAYAIETLGTFCCRTTSPFHG
ncbi:hypothetical protein NDU88_011051 [Pleurodeles waltl]|uniref:Phospholipase A2 inhibitor and Ly6/PLAUR domain-containing protein-like n=1 Tax=Pleurodeles waltl TaxID=8319 RepID=A0AAV7Q3N2_PLEWA|nr:hypothetical protein NDU88_011051 [Pleurodeles waltl]